MVLENVYKIYYANYKVASIITTKTHITYS